MYLVYDTETTDLPNFGIAANHPKQARIVQLACVLMDEAHKEVASFCSLIKPCNWVIQSGAQAAHGISQQECVEKGIGIEVALSVFNEFDRLCDLHIAHNIKFDSFLIKVERELLFGMGKHSDKQQFCTMLSMTNICRLPGKYGKYKWPKLQEVHEYLFHAPFEGAHDALADVRACAKVYKWLRGELTAPSVSAQDALNVA